MRFEYANRFEQKKIPRRLPFILELFNATRESHQRLLPTGFTDFHENQVLFLLTISFHRFDGIAPDTRNE